jgi:release factor glutamine methyltransferase
VKVAPRLKAGASISDAVHMLVQALRLADIDSPEADARLLIGHAMHLDRAQLIAQSDRILEAREAAAIKGLCERRLKREPIARIFGRKEFWNLTLVLDPSVLVPRPETETVVEAALDFVVRGGLRNEKLRLLDIGTGSGALLLALLSELPNAAGIGTDLRSAALQVAQSNAERNGLAARCSFVACDIVTGIAGPFDLIVSNPPYIARGEIAALAAEVRDYDPTLALDGGLDGLHAYRAIAAQTGPLLAPGGRLIVELGAGQQPAVHALFTKAGLTVRAVTPDLAGIPRALTASLPP